MAIAGRVCVPMTFSQIETFDPLLVPTVGSLLAELELVVVAPVKKPTSPSEGTVKGTESREEDIRPSKKLKTDLDNIFDEVIETSIKVGGGDQNGEDLVKSGEEWEKTSLKPYIDLFKNHVDAIVREAMVGKRGASFLPHSSVDYTCDDVWRVGRNRADVNEQRKRIRWSSELIPCEQIQKRGKLHCLYHCAVISLRSNNTPSFDSKGLVAHSEISVSCYFENEARQIHTGCRPKRSSLHGRCHNLNLKTVSLSPILPFVSKQLQSLAAQSLAPQYHI